MITLGHLGTFDVENYGDLLYPLVLKHVLKRYETPLSVSQYSFLSGRAPQDAGFETIALRNLFNPTPVPPNRLVIGGGDILRTDRELIATHYQTAYRNYYGRLRNSLGLINAWQYLLRRSFWPRSGSKFYADQFRSRWMKYPGAGPFLIDPDDLPDGTRICYLSCGVPHEFTPPERERVKRIFERARFIYLRDEQSAEKLRRADVQCEIRVAPDLTVTLSDQFNPADEARRGRAVLARLGVAGDRPVLCFQSKPYPGFNEEEIAQQLKHYSERARADVVLLPTGYCLGDHEFLHSLSRQSGGAFKYAGVDSVFDILAIIAASDVFVGTSLHGNITAASFGIPHLFGPLPVDKAEGFLSAMNLPAELKLQSWREINAKIDMTVGLGRAFFSGRAREAKSKVYRVVDELLQVLLK
jgi:hypothetical protein